MENQEKIKDCLTEFEKTPSKEIPPILEDYLKTVAKTGKTVFPWNLLKCLFIQKLEQVMEQFNKDEPCERQTPLPNVENAKFDNMQQRIIEAMQKFSSAPFTVQRLCELVTQPKKHYTKCDKFMRGIEKNVMVVSTVDPNGKKIVSESRVMVNGLDSNGVGQPEEFGDFTEDPPFVPVPQIDWASGHAATVWPSQCIRQIHPNYKSDTSDIENKENDDEVFNFKTKDGAEDKVTNGDREEVRGESEETVDNKEDNTNNSASSSVKDQNICVTDSVKLPQASSLFSNIQKEVSESKSDSAESGEVFKCDSSSESTESVKDITNETANSSEEPQDDKVESDMERKETGSEEMDAKSESSEASSTSVEESTESSNTDQPRDSGSVVRPASDEGDGPPEKKMKFSPVDEESKENESEVKDSANEGTAVADLPESMRESCQDSDTMPFVPSANQEVVECDSSQSLSSLVENKPSTESDQSNDSLENKQEVASEVPSEFETKESDEPQSSGNNEEAAESEDVSAENKESVSEENKSSEQKEQVSSAENKENTEETEEKAQGEAMDTEVTSEKSDSQAETDGTEPMDHE